MMADLFRHVTILLVESDIFERLALWEEARLSMKRGAKVTAHTSIGLNGFAIRPIVEE
jgi:hypothetical protein